MEPGLIADDEAVYRRVSARSGWYDPKSERPVAWDAFRPNVNDKDGLSVWLSTCLSPSDAALRNARPDKRYYVLEVGVSDLRDLGVEVVYTPGQGGIGHVSLANMTYDAYQEDKNRIRELAGRIAVELVRKVHGPFGPINK